MDILERLRKEREFHRGLEQEYIPHEVMDAAIEEIVRLRAFRDPSDHCPERDAALAEAIQICNEEWNRAGVAEDLERKGFGASAQAWISVVASRIQNAMSKAKE